MGQGRFGTTDAKIFRLIYLEKWTMDEVAHCIHKSRTVIYGRISRGRKQLRDEMKVYMGLVGVIVDEEAVAGIRK